MCGTYLSHGINIIRSNLSISSYITWFEIPYHWIHKYNQNTYITTYIYWFMVYEFTKCLWVSKFWNLLTYSIPDDKKRYNLFSLDFVSFHLTNRSSVSLIILILNMVRQNDVSGKSSQYSYTLFFFYTIGNYCNRGHHPSEDPTGSH